MKKLLTIIIPTYNMEEFLGRCLDSLMMKNDEWMQRVEVLVIDDGSKDQSLNIAQRYAKEHPTAVRVIHKENGNYGSCINRGLDEATGEYVKVLDADDWFDTQNLEGLLRCMDEHRVDAVISSFDKVDSAQKTLASVQYSLPTDREFTLQQLDGNTIRTLMMHGVAYRTAMVRDLNYRQSEGISYTDQEWIFLPMAHAKTLAYYPLPVYKYLCGRAGQTMDTKVWDRNFGMELQGMRRMLELYAAYSDKVDDEAKRYLQERLAARNYSIYDAYFIRFDTTQNHQLMREYDLMLKAQHPHLWNKAADYSFFKMKYVTRWRNANYPTHVFGLSLCRALGKSIKGS